MYAYLMSLHILISGVKSQKPPLFLSKLPFYPSAHLFSHFNVNYII